MSSRPVAALLVASLALLVARPARAQVGFYSGPGSVYVVTPDRSLLSVDGQYYSPTPRGIMDLCQGKPDLCASPGVQDDVARLRRNYHGALGMVIGGTALSLAGAGLVVGGLVQTPASKPLFISGIAGAGAGLVLVVVSSFVAPNLDSIRHIVNRINGEHDEGHRIRWDVGMGPRGEPHLTVSGTF